MQFILLLKVCGLLVLIESLEARNIKEEELGVESAPTNLQTENSFGYDETNVPRHYFSSSYRQQQKSSHLTTTPRPFVSYWQNLVRNVRLPVPSITWNVTNPLANLFNAGTESYMPIDEVVDDYYEGSSQRRHKNKKRRKPHNKRHRKNKRPNTGDPFTEEQQQQELENAAAQQVLLPPYPINNNVDLDTPMYFYDPNTESYYAVQRVRALSPYMLGPTSKPETTNALHQNINAQQMSQNSNEVALNADDEDGDDINLEEAEEIDLDQVAKNEPAPANKIAHNEQQSEKIEKPKNSFLNEENVRNVLGTYMRDDSHNRQKQRSKEKKNLNNRKQIKPRKQQNYYFLLDVN